MISKDEALNLFNKLDSEIQKEIENGKLFKLEVFSDLKEVMKWHRFLWNWIALRIAIDKDISDKRALKRSFFETYFMKINAPWPDTDNLCFICEFYYHPITCPFCCPVNWNGDDGGHCLWVGSPFKNFQESTTVEEAYGFALDVANVEVKTIWRDLMEE